MKKILLLSFIMLFAVTVNSQIKIQEGFETADSLNLPAGWTKINNQLFPIDPFTNWTVRDTGVGIPGINTRLTQAHSGQKSAAVTWWSSIDTTGAPSTVADVWLITKDAGSITSNDVLKFWAFGGTFIPNFYKDSLQIWVSTTDSNTYSFLDKLGSINWPLDSTWGTWRQFSYSLSQFAGATNLWVGFRYYMDCTVDGYCVFIDDVFVGDPTGITQIGSETPSKFSLQQNYPNPFNPTTTIRFDIAKMTDVKLVIYNSLGEEVQVLSEGVKAPGRYELKFDASKLASGVYFYRLFAGSYIETKKMMVIK